MTDSAPEADDTVVDAEPAPPIWEQHRHPHAGWAIVEIMGHQVRAGSVSDIQIAGATMLRIQHPTVADHAGRMPLTECYSSSAIFSYRPCSREAAAHWAEARWQRPQPTPAIAELAALHDAHEEDDDVWYPEYDED